MTRIDTSFLVLLKCEVSKGAKVFVILAHLLLLEVAIYILPIFDSSLLIENTKCVYVISEAQIHSEVKAV